MIKLISILTILLPFSVFASSDLDEARFAELERVITQTERKMNSAQKSIKEAKNLFIQFPELSGMKGKRIADVGSGFGHKSRAMNRQGNDVVCIEPNAVDLDIRAGIPAGGLMILHNKVEDTPSPVWKTFDIVTCFNMPFHLIKSDKEAFDFFAALFHLLKDDAELLVTLGRGCKKSKSQFKKYQSYFALFFPNSKNERRKISDKARMIVLSARRQALNWQTIKLMERRLNLSTSQPSSITRNPPIIKNAPIIKFELPQSLQISQETTQKLRECMKEQIDKLATEFSDCLGVSGVVFSINLLPDQECMKTNIQS